ncbi:hypothetical protein XO10_08410 [Marinitoga sp. 1135]|uniref:thioredoxin family protein n=1 Tax=unclassified Marinitoga TaxID=2640159 RepID=UPI001586DE40|nr:MULTISPECIES: thioredoxin fold domain-containing protein [unclassified Marinitoga]NUU96282.1 hypothetical protein [Marinitoga sp. 1135]NUU98201.1 hypothetical protein [Marinitoga sp. 1138]
MKKISLFILLIISGVIMYGSILPDKFIVHDFNVALKIGEITGKKVIIMFSSGSCYYCNKFKKETLYDEEVQKWLRTEYIFAEIYADKKKIANYKGKTLNYRDLFGAFGVRGTPTFFFFDSKGEAKAQLPGYVDPTTFISILKYFKYSSNHNIDYSTFVKKNIKVSIEKRVLNLTDEEIKYLLENDPNTVEYQKGDSLDNFVNVIVKEKSKEIESKFYVVIYSK